MVKFKKGFLPAKTVYEGLNQLTFLRYELLPQVPSQHIGLVFAVHGENINTTQEYPEIFDFTSTDIMDKDKPLAIILNKMGFVEPETKTYIKDGLIQVDDTGIGNKVLQFLKSKMGAIYLAELVNNNGDWVLKTTTLQVKK
jgi:hypothetical protein